MTDWVRKPLSDVVELRRGFDLPRDHRRDGPYPVLSAGATAGWHAEGPVRGPGLVIGRVTNLGQPTWCDSDFWPLNTTLYAADFKGNVARWVLHLFETLDLSRFNSGSVQPTLNRNYIAQVEVAVPPITEQQAIAEVLGALDAKIAMNSRLAASAEELAVSLLSRVEASVPLSEVASVSRLMIYPETLADPVVAHFSLPAFDSGRGPDRVTPAQIKSGKFRVERPAVLLSKLNPRFPRVWDLAALPDEPALASTEFVVLHPVFCSTTVLWALISQPRFGAALEGMVAGTSGSHQRVKPAEILATPVGDPRVLPVELTDHVTALGRAAQSARAENLTLAATRDALLPALMSGTLRVRDAEQLAETLT